MKIYCLKYPNKLHLTAVDLGVQGTRADPLGPNFFIFMQFSTKIVPNNRVSAPSWETLDLPLFSIYKGKMK